MFHNVGKIDRVIRLSVALVLGVLYFTKVIEGTWAIVAIVAASVLFLTGLRSCCPIYAVLGFGTCGVSTKETDKKIETGKLDL